MGAEKWKNRSKRPEERAYECKAIYTDNREEAGTEGRKQVMRQKGKAGRGDAV